MNSGSDPRTAMCLGTWLSGRSNGMISVSLSLILFASVCLNLSVSVCLSAFVSVCLSEVSPPAEVGNVAVLQEKRGPSKGTEVSSCSALFDVTALARRVFPGLAPEMGTESILSRSRSARHRTGITKDLHFKLSVVLPKFMRGQGLAACIRLAPTICVWQSGRCLVRCRITKLANKLKGYKRKLCGGFLLWHWPGMLRPRRHACRQKHRQHLDMTSDMAAS